MPPGDGYAASRFYSRRPFAMLIILLILWLTGNLAGPMMR